MGRSAKEIDPSCAAHSKPILDASCPEMGEHGLLGVAGYWYLGEPNAQADLPANVLICYESKAITAMSPRR